jgi:holliday junction DNA helicase RuvA
MIAWLRGIVRESGDDTVVLDVHGVGWSVAVSELDRAALTIGQAAELMIHMVVREDAMLLYGFRAAAARELFVALVSVPGVGPKGALALMSDAAPAVVARAIHDEDIKTLIRAKGIGKRTAELIVVRLRERLPTSLLVDSAVTALAKTPKVAGASADVESALINLGYRPVDARSAVDAAIEAAGDEAAAADFDRLLRESLALLRRATGRGKGQKQ